MMTAQQQRIMQAFGVAGLGIETTQITSSVGAGVMTAGGVIAAIPGLQLPGAIVAAVGALTTLIGGLFKPDLTKIEASRIVDAIEAQTLKPMRASWDALPASKKTVSMQSVYLQIFDKAWAAVVQGCSNPALGTAGSNCISDRAEGACHYTVDGQTPGVPPNCGNWFVWYRNPIANDPNVIPDPAPAADDAGSGPLASLFAPGASVAGVSPLLLIGAALVGVGLLWE